MIAHHMSCSNHFANDIRPLPHIAADHKKRGLHSVLRENLQHLQRIRIVGAIVKGQRQLLRLVP